MLPTRSLPPSGGPSFHRRRRATATPVAATLVAAVVGAAVVGAAGPAAVAGWSGVAPLAETASIIVADGVMLEVRAWHGLKPLPAATGLVPIDLKFDNGNDRPVGVRVVGGVRDGLWGPWGGMVPNATIRLPAGATVATRLLADPWPNPTGRAHVSVGAEAGNVLRIALEPTFVPAAAAAGAPPAAAITRGVDDLPGAAQADLGKPWGIVASGDCPADWRGWTMLTRLAITADEWRALPGDVKDAARHWLALGGRLTVFGSDATVDGLPADGVLGVGRIDYRSSSDGSVLGGVPLRNLSADVTTIDGVAPSRLLRGMGYQPFIGDSLTRLVGARGLPVVALMVILVLLAVVAGPVNLLVFARAGRRARLFWTTPLITIGATAVLLSFMMLRDGIGGVGVRRVLCVLLPEQTSLAVIQEQATRTGVLLRTDFPIAEPAWMLPIGDYPPGAVAFESGSGRRSGDWFQGRGDQAHALFAVRPSRSRVTVVETAADGTPTIVSSLDQTLAKVFYRDDGGEVWTTGALPAGVRRACIRSTEEALLSFIRDMRADAGPFPTRALDRLGRLRGHVFATGDDVASAAIGTLDSIRWRSERVVFAGPVVDEAKP